MASEGELFSEMDHPRLSDRIYDLIRERIIRHDLPPGARLRELDIAAELGVSRTPVRMATTRLAEAGLLKVIPRRGVFVPAPTEKDIVDLYEVREVLEVLGVRSAIPQLTDDDITSLNNILEHLETALKNNDAIGCFELDKEFHDELVQLSGNSKLDEIYALIGGSIQVTRWFHCNNESIQAVSMQEHRALLDAMIERDTDLACDLLRDHLRRVKKDLLEGFAKNTRKGAKS